MKLTKKEARMVVYDDHSDFEVKEENIIDTSRWSIIKKGIFQHIPSGKFYSLEWSEGATECQEEKPFEYTEPELIEVEQVEKTVLMWEPV